MKIRVSVWITVRTEIIFKGGQAITAALERTHVFLLHEWEISRCETQNRFIGVYKQTNLSF
jgi:hypothetical protein